MEENNNINVNENENNENQQQEETKLFTEQDVMRMIQAEADRRTNQALAKQKREFEKKLSLASLDETKREAAEKDMRIQELEEQVRNFNVLQQKTEVMKTLSSRGIPTEFCDYLSITDAVERNPQLISNFDRLWKNAIKEQVEKKLAGNSPKGSENKGIPMDKAAFDKLPVYEQDRLCKTNDYYKQFI